MATNTDSTHKNDQTPNDGIVLNFTPAEQQIASLPKETILETARRGSVTIVNACGGRGICKSCIVQYKDDTAPPASEQDQHFFSKAKLAKGWRRACQTVPQQDSVIQVPKRSTAQASRVFVAGNDMWVHPEPMMESISVTLQPPTMQDCLSDDQRLINAVNAVKPGSCNSIYFHVLLSLSSFLREEMWSVQAIVRESEIIAVLPIGSPMLGLAMDLGTTNFCLMLVDLQTGDTLVTKGVENPQSKYGADVIARMYHVKGKPAALKELQQATVASINEAAREMCEKVSLSVTSIVDIVAAANTTIHHILLGLSVDYLGMAPFPPVARTTEWIGAEYLGIHAAPGAHLYAMDNIAGYVGGDHTAMLLGIRADLEKRTVVAMDIGTNTEFSLIHKDKYYCLSTPSGPALEGGSISCGMRAADGAIEGIKVTGDEVALKVIGNCEPVGICGSAVLDAVAEFFRIGAIDPTGKIDPSSIFADNQEKVGIVLRLSKNNPDIVFSQLDVRNVQLAKSAIRTGIEMLLDSAGLVAEDLDKIIIAGAFGVFISLESALAIGMLPNLQRDRFEQVGNAAGVGAKLALVSGPLREQAGILAAASTHQEQAGAAGYTKLFMEHLKLPSEFAD